MATLELFTYIYSLLFMDCCRSMFPFEKELCDLQNVSNIQSHVLPSISVLVGKRLAEAIERAQEVFTVLLFIPHPFSIALQHPPTPPNLPPWPQPQPKSVFLQVMCLCCKGSACRDRCPCLWTPQGIKQWEIGHWLLHRWRVPCCHFSRSKRKPHFRDALGSL